MNFTFDNGIMILSRYIMDNLELINRFNVSSSQKENGKFIINELLDRNNAFNGMGWVGYTLGE